MRIADANANSYADGDTYTDGDADRDAYWHANLHAGRVATGGEHANRPVWGGRGLGWDKLLCRGRLLLQFWSDPGCIQPLQPGHQHLDADDEYAAGGGVRLCGLLSAHE